MSGLEICRSSTGTCGEKCRAFPDLRGLHARAIGKDSQYPLEKVPDYARVSKDVCVKPGAEIGSLGEPWICEDLPTPRLDKSAGLTKIGNTHGISLESW